MEIRITAKQFGFLLFLSRTGHAIVVLHQTKVLQEHPDAWIATLVGTALSLLPIWLLAAGAARAPDLTLVDRFRSALGNFLGSAAGWVLVLFFLFNGALTVRLFATLLTSQPMPETPLEVFVALLVVGTAYAARHGPEVTARVGEVIAPLVFLGMLFVLLLATHDMDVRNLKPYLHAPAPLLVAGVLTTVNFTIDLLILPMLAPLLDKPGQIVRTSMIAAAASGLFIALATAAVVMFYAPAEAQRVLFPLYDMARSLTASEYLERLDPIFLVGWTMTSYVKVALFLWAAASSAATLLRIKDYRPLIGPLSLIALFLALLIYKSVAELITFLSPRVLTFLALPLLCLVILAGLARSAKAERRASG